MEKHLTTEEFKEAMEKVIIAKNSVLHYNGQNNFKHCKIRDLGKLEKGKFFFIF
ncbi:MAG: hypothetical protein LBU74_00885 [Methanobacteriaceae archaeon]|jgi:hypothetical protein|nr:hypothetical protein [Candidatus Methanorudis spinitermitis]